MPQFFIGGKRFSTPSSPAIRYAAACQSLTRYWNDGGPAEAGGSRSGVNPTAGHTAMKQDKRRSCEPVRLPPWVSCGQRLHDDPGSRPASSLFVLRGQGQDARWPDQDDQGRALAADSPGMGRAVRRRQDDPAARPGSDRASPATGQAARQRRDQLQKGRMGYECLRSPA